MSENKDAEKSLAHDLLNSLTIVDGNLHLALESDGGSTKEFIQKAINANQKAIQKCQSALKESNRTQIGLYLFLKKYIKDLIDQFPELNIKIHFEYSEQSTKRYDEILLYRVIENILINSKEAGAKNVDLILKKDSLCIYDNGKGITKQDKKILASSKTTKPNGNGIGLALVAKFCLYYNLKTTLKNNTDQDLYSNGVKVCLKSNGVEI